MANPTPALLLAFLLALGSPLRGQMYEGMELVRPELLADTQVVVPGKPFRVGLLLRMAPKWHTYWHFPGDAGLATSIQWTLPEGFTAGPIQWPIPHETIEPGDIEVFAYHDETLLITTITPPATLPAGEVTLKASASWLVCEEICIPGNAGNLSITIPVGPSAEPANAAIFAKYDALLPKPGPWPYGIGVQPATGGFEVKSSALPAGSKLAFYPLPPNGESAGRPVTSGAGDSQTVQIPWKAGTPLTGVIVLEQGESVQGWTVDGIPEDAVATKPSPSPDAESSAAPPLNLWTAMFLGFLGGMILNVMPCVLPVISLKIFGFIRHGGEDRRKVLAHGVAFALGIVTWFLVLAAVVVGVKAAGHQITWGSQFQSPVFIVGLCIILFVFALNLLGVFEVILPGAATERLVGAGGGGGLGGTFSQGVFATLLATPCTAPFMGPALGFAFGQPPLVIIATFLAIAIGMAIPYVILAANPGWIKRLPKPGAWMERVKQMMAFPLLATLVWMIDILGQQRGVGAIVSLLGYLLCLAMACWIYGAFCGPLTSLRVRAIALALILALGIGGGILFLGKGLGTPVTSTGATKVGPDGIPWVPFSREALAKLKAEGKGVFIDFTAAWCLICKANERSSIDRAKVREALAKSGIVPMKADWTNSDPEITAELQKFGRVGVPFYVIFPAGRPDEPIILPELLTESIVLDAIVKATTSPAGPPTPGSSANGATPKTNQP